MFLFQLISEANLDETQICPFNYFYGEAQEEDNITLTQQLNVFIDSTQSVPVRQNTNDYVVDQNSQLFNEEISLTQDFNNLIDHGL